MAMIGPGRLVLVVGPSGAGKDTLIGLARAQLHHDPTVVFVRRVVTRAPSPHEDHDTLSAEAFEQALRSGAFALAWEAHGLRYGVPASINSDIRAGRTVVCNVSRAIVGQARGLYADVVVALVTAPADVLARRLAARAREEGIDGRLARAEASDDIRADCVITNVGAPESSAAALIAAILAKAAARSPAS
jgi:ribose 1,5-bisphosphokinase